MPLTINISAVVNSAAKCRAMRQGSLNSIAWGKKVLLVGLGMVIYSEIVSPGYFAQLGQWVLVVMFAVLLFGAVFGVMKLLQEKTS